MMSLPFGIPLSRDRQLNLTAPNDVYYTVVVLLYCIIVGCMKLFSYLKLSLTVAVKSMLLQFYALNLKKEFCKLPLIQLYHTILFKLNLQYQIKRRIVKSPVDFREFITVKRTKVTIANVLLLLLSRFSVYFSLQTLQFLLVGEEKYFYSRAKRII